MGQKNRYTVEIGNNSYVLVTSRDEKETDLIVKYVDSEISKAKDQIKYRNQAMYATLACLNIADSLYTVSQEYEDLKKRAEEPIREYGPLKKDFEDYKKKHQDVEKTINDLSDRVKNLEKDLNLAELDRDKYKLELDRQINNSKKDREDLEDLRKKLMKQEKMTLNAKKQLQEVLEKGASK